jgi:hypothetical protein
MKSWQRHRARLRGEAIPKFKPGPKPLTNRKRFEKRFSIDSNGCWIWQSKNRHKFGYGKFRIWPGRKTYDAHRAAWLIYKGEIPAGQWILHRCGVAACVNPEHLYLGTHLRNMRDMVEHGRARTGERNPAAKLSDVQVIMIREMKKAGKSVPFLMQLFSVSQSHIYRILNRERRAIPI